MKILATLGVAGKHQPRIVNFGQRMCMKGRVSALVAKRVVCWARFAFVSSSQNRTHAALSARNPMMFCRFKSGTDVLFQIVGKRAVDRLDKATVVNLVVPKNGA